jgi:hypothetical protein
VFPEVYPDGVWLILRARSCSASHLPVQQHAKLTETHPIRRSCAQSEISIHTSSPVWLPTFWPAQQQSHPPSASVVDHFELPRGQIIIGFVSFR